MFGFAALYLNLGNIIYGSPFADIEYLLTEGYYGHKIYMNALISATASPTGEVFSVVTGFAVLMVWIIVLFAFRYYYLIEYIIEIYTRVR